MANPYAVDHSQNTAPMDRSEFDRLLKSRLYGRCALALGLGFYFGEVGNIEISKYRITGSELSAVLICVGVIFCTRALRCRTRSFDRMRGFVRYEELEARAQELEQRD